LDTLSQADTQTLEYACNYFPHAALGGKSPAQVYFEQSGRFPE
jgi:hypothetical protein